jgi:hypothetical protein
MRPSKTYRRSAVIRTFPRLDACYAAPVRSGHLPDIRFRRKATQSGGIAHIC